jgi:hypothetical protein
MLLFLFGWDDSRKLDGDTCPFSWRAGDFDLAVVFLYDLAANV